jgi:hypothetical protein
MISQLNNLQLSASVQLHAQSGIFEASSAGDLSKLESEILTRFLQEDGRVFQQPNRLLVTYDNIGLLIKNLPEDANKQNPLTHTLSHYVENANAVLLNIDTSLSPKPALNNALAGSECLQLLAQLNTHAQSQQVYKKASVQIIDELIATLEAACVDLALTYNQEQALMNILHNGIDKSLKQYEVGTQLDEQCELSLKSLGRALGQ